MHSKGIKYLDFEMTISETVAWFNSIYELNKMQGEGKSAFYCGITNDTDSRKKEHNVGRFLGVTKCDTFETAKKLESLMHDEGYDTGMGLQSGHCADEEYRFGTLDTRVH